VTQVHSSIRTFGPSVAGDAAIHSNRLDLLALKPIVAVAATGFGFALIDVSVAETKSDIMAANALLVDRYVPKGYSVDWVAENIVSEDAPVLIAKNRLDGTALATLTLRIDGDSGLVAERLYPGEVTRLREDGRRLCEVVRFASTPSFRSIDLLRRLFDSATILGRRLDRTDVMIEVTPRHAAFYKRILGFRALGSPRHNPRVNTTGMLLHANVGELSDRVGQASRQGLELLSGTEAVAALAADSAPAGIRISAPVS
jgi:hypothetical protein